MSGPESTLKPETFIAANVISEEVYREKVIPWNS